jgi:hypothetical protein
MKQFLKQMQQGADHSTGAMGTGDHFKNGANPKNQTSMGNHILNIFFVFLLLSLSIVGCEKEPLEQEDDTNTQPQEFVFDCTDSSEVVEIEYMGETILCNYVNGQYIIEGDIVLKDDNIDNDTVFNNSSITRGAIIESGLWEEGKVYYGFSSQNNSTILSSEVQKAMNEITSKTNIKFIPIYTPEALEYIRNRNKGYTVFVSNNSMNSSPVGKVSTSNFSTSGTIPPYNEIRLIRNNNAALHEICHTIGMIHEHSRPGRDNHVNINYSNIKSGKEHNFTIKPFAVYAYPTNELDFGSVMMYNSWAFSKDCVRLVTIERKNGLPFYTQRDNLSENDAHVINRMYPQLPVVTPDIIIHTKNIQPKTTSCELTGELIYAGEPAATEFGIAWKEKSSSAPMTYQKGTEKDRYGVYKCQLTDLKPDTDYEAVAYVKQNEQPFFSDYTIFFTTQSLVFELDIVINEKRESIYSEWVSTYKHYNTELRLHHTNENSGQATLSSFFINEMIWYLASTGWPNYYPISVIHWSNGSSSPHMQYTYLDDFEFVWLNISFSVDINEARIDEVITGPFAMGELDFYNQGCDRYKGQATLTRIE